MFLFIANDEAAVIFYDGGFSIKKGCTQPAGQISQSHFQSAPDCFDTSPMNFDALTNPPYYHFLNDFHNLALDFKKRIHEQENFCVGYSGWICYY